MVRTFECGPVRNEKTLPHVSNKQFDTCFVPLQLVTPHHAP